MKTSTFFGWIFLCFAFAGTTTIFSCECKKDDDNPLLCIESNWADPPVPNQYILYFRDSFFDTPDTLLPVTDTFIQGVVDRMVDSGDVVAKYCMCGKIYLMETPDSIEPSERVQEAEEEFGPSGDPSKKGVFDRNYSLSMVDMPGLSGLNDIMEIDTVSRNITGTVAGSVVVAITDTGFQPKNGTGLQAFTWFNSAEVSDTDALEDGNCIKRDLNGADIFNQSGNLSTDDNHGTAVAGRVAGRPATGLDTELLGLPNGIDLQMINVRFIQQGSSTLFDAVCALRYSVEQGADLITASWGAKSDTLYPSMSEVLTLANRRKVTVVAAAGNHNGVNIDDCKFLPASYAGEAGFENVISVAAMNDTQSGIAGFSNIGPNSVMLAAPGEAIDALTVDGTIEPVDGTSIAAPIVARTVSIIRAHQPNISHADLRTFLLDNTANIHGLSNIRFGMLDHCAALHAAGIPCP